MRHTYRLRGRAAALFAGLALLATTARAQTPGVGIGTTAPDVSAALDIVSSTKGALLPRVASTAAVPTPATGLIVFQTNAPAGYYYNVGTPGTPDWQQLATVAGAAITANNGLTKTGQNIALGGPLTGATTVDLGTNDLTFGSSGGRVGIGSVLGGFRLHVDGQFRSTLANGSFSTYSNAPGGGTVLLGAFDGTGGFGPQLRFSGSGVTNSFIDIGENAAGDFVVEGNDSPRLTVLNGGGVGVGIGTPGKTLDVLGSIGLRNNAAWDHLYFSHDGSTAFMNAGGADTGLALRVGNGGGGGYDAQTYTEVMRLRPNGNVGIGIVVPGARLDVEGGGLQVGGNGAIGTQGAHLQWNRSGGEGETWLLNQKGLSTNGNDGIRFGKSDQSNGLTEWARFIGNGNFGVGDFSATATPAPSATLDVNGTARVRGLTAGVVSASSNGTLSSGTATAAFGTEFIQNTTTQQPSSNFNISGNGVLAGTLRFNSTDTDKIYLTLLGAAGSKIGHAVNWGVLNYAGPGTGGTVGYHSWLTTGASAYTEQMRLSNTELSLVPSLRLGTDGAFGTTGNSAAVEFDGPSVNTDLIGLYRSNTGPNASELHLALGDDADVNDRFVLGTTNAGGSTAGNLLGAGFNPKFTVLSNGSTAIGTSAPLARLDIQGGADSDGSNDPVALGFGYRGGGFRHFVRSRHNGGLGGGGNNLDFFLNNSATPGGSSAPGTGNVPAMTIENNAGGGRLGLGTLTPQGKLHIVTDNSSGNAEDDYLLTTTAR